MHGYPFGNSLPPAGRLSGIFGESRSMQLSTITLIIIIARQAKFDTQRADGQ